MTLSTRARILLLILFSSQIILSAKAEESVHVTVAKDSVNLRTAPDIHSKPAKIRLNKGDVLIVRRSTQSDWYEIQLPFPFKGLYVRQDLVALDQVKDQAKK